MLTQWALWKQDKCEVEVCYSSLTASQEPLRLLALAEQLSSPTCVRVSVLLESFAMDPSLGQVVVVELVPSWVAMVLRKVHL